ncbi:MAG TPA: hypothetical protein PLP17_10230 [Oligoflexia bacterium]|nr:hypothetical protein [Oligoflexia bacterium]
MRRVNFCSAVIVMVGVFLFVGNGKVCAEEAAVQEEESALSLEVVADFATDYMFRGQNLYDGTSIQPSVSGGYDFGELGKVNALVWSHLSAEGGQGASEKFTEVDFDLSYEIGIDILTLAAGHLWYTFPDSGDDINETNEFYVSASLDTILAPTFTYYRDYREFDNNFFELGLSHEIECSKLGEGFNLTPSVTFGWATNAEKVYDEDSGLMYVEAGLSSEVEFGIFTLVPSFNYTFQVDDSTQNEFWFKIGVGYSLI